jgi:serine/threonine protein kinase
MKYCTICKAKYEDAVSFCPVDGEVLEDDPSSFVNTVLDGQYQIEAMLGKGGMGAVYRARHILLGDRVAIKILPPEMRNNAEWLRRFRREGQAARRFRHPNAVTVYDLRTASDGMIYMVMEYVEGRTLDAELKARGSFTPAEALEILAPVMSVLNAAHAMGVVHRDLKPENIMIGKMTTGGEPTVKLLDLGIAKLREVAGADGGGNTALTMAGQMLGTPYYMSPEQWGELPRDGNPEIDGRADIYSLGLVFYETIAGQRPYSSLTLLELRKEHVSSTPKRLDEVVTDVPPAFSDAIERAIAKDRGDRQATANELAAELKEALATAEPGQPQVERATGTGKPTVAIGKSSETKSDVDAPTIITLDLAPEVDTKILVPTPPAGSPQGQAALASAATIAESADMASSITVPQAPKPKPAQPREVSPEVVAPVPQIAPRPRRRSILPIIGGVLVLLLIVGGVGGFFLMNWMKAKPAGTNGGNKNGPSNSSTAETGTAKEVARYWLEILPKPTGSHPMRVAGLLPIASGQSYKFHFTPSESGYLYIVGPGEQNVPTAFLTAKPAAKSGLQTNEVKKGVDLSFPTGDDNWLELDKNPGTETYTLIFSPTPLTSPQFLSEEATGHPLNATEQGELTSFLARYKTNSLAAELNDKNAAEPFMTVKLPASGAAGNPIVFEIRIEHK